MMRAKLAIADSWYKEGGTAALTQAEQEYKDFITFFPNAPEAAEAQMRVGDIYFRQMDKPDRDYTNTVHAEEEYRLMLQQFPDSTLVPQAKQRLREVQEVLASREANIAAFYATHDQLARHHRPLPDRRRHLSALQPHGRCARSDSATPTRAKRSFVRTLKLPEAGKARLEKIYDDQAIAAYTKVVLEHSAAAHVEDARDRLDALNVPIPTPTPEQIAASVALENSRRQYRLQDRATLLFMHTPDVVLTARDGEPTLTDPTPTLAPQVTKKIINDFNSAMNPNAPAPSTTLTPNTAAATTAAAAPGAGSTTGASAAPAPAAAPPAAPLQFQEIPAANAAAIPSSSTTTETVAAPTSSAGSGNSMGVEILNSGSSSSNAAPPPDSNGGLHAVGPPNATPLPEAEKAATAPSQTNDVAGTATPAAQAANPNGKNGKPEFDKSDESSSKHRRRRASPSSTPSKTK